ncbi:MAG: chorismate synthase [Saprospiraceae bacterium]|jgi:chorismate synthase|nr:chorismate synthase [Saprospiraceae bacterium]MBP6567920.1 chorismate synthase [Saprospiraceae bacterium]
MAANTFGEVFRVTTFGESHGLGIGLIIDGCPAGLDLDLTFIQHELDRRKPGQSKIVTQRKEDESFVIQSGVFEGKTTGTPISIFIPNTDQKSKDYSHISSIYRPSHADFTYQAKYGVRDYAGGGRSSARETAARVAAGSIAKMILNGIGVKINAFVSQVGHVKLDESETLDLTQTEENMVRCPHPQTAQQMIDLIMDVKKSGDTIGGMVSCVIEGCPVGLGAPVFDKLHADLGKAMLSINAVKGFEYGSGFRCITMLGSEHNDIFINQDGNIKTKTNNSGGIQGGISNGMPINFNVAFKPVATIVQGQDTVDTMGKDALAEGKGRHDPCVVPRAVPIVEAMAALVLVDHFLRNKTIKL